MLLQYHPTPMTVGDLIRLLQHYPSEALVLAKVPNEWCHSVVDLTPHPEDEAYCVIRVEREEPPTPV